jgi:Na+/H+-dicarboxylate symporter
MTLVSCQVKKAKKPLEESSVKKNKLPRRIAMGIALGVLVGWACHHFAGSEQSAKEIASYFSMVTDIFLRMIKMIIAPLVFATLVGGIASTGNSRSVGRIGLRAMAWFVTASVISLAIGMGLVNLFQPGAGLNMEVVQHAASPVVVNTGDFSLKVFISHVFPRSIAEAMANNEILQIVVFSLFFGFALAGVKRAGYTTIVDSIEELAKVMFKVTDFVMAFAPIGIFAAIASAITTQGLGLIVDYGKLIAEFYLGIVILWCVLFTAGYLFLGRSVFTLGKLIREPVLLAFSTASSESAYPKTMEALEKFGAPKRVSSFVLPLGYSFNLDGSMMYHLLILGIDQFLDMARTATNVVGNSIATAVVAKSEPHEEVEEAPGTKSPLPIHTAATA